MSALIEMPKNTRTKIYGERRFDVAAGTLWNSLPASLRNEQYLEAFKKGLKTHLFIVHFEDLLEGYSTESQLPHQTSAHHIF
jgi:hypothetical protein